MKKLTLLSFIVIILSTLISCEKKNEPPTCKIILPENNSIFGKGTIVHISVEANDSDGTVTEVRFYFDGIGTKSVKTFPYNYDWNTDDVTTGLHEIKVTAIDNQGAETSTKIEITIEQYNIGESYAGGIIYYVDSTGLHGLVCAEDNQSTGAEWGCYGIEITGADGTAVGTGVQNTADIVAGCSIAGIAAKICADLVLNDYDDWFLPSKDELNLMYTNLHLHNLGSFAQDVYWSSTEESANLAWCKDFSYGGQGGGGKVATIHVKAIRTF